MICRCISAGPWQRIKDQNLLRTSSYILAKNLDFAVAVWIKEPFEWKKRPLIDRWNIPLSSFRACYALIYHSTVYNIAVIYSAYRTYRARRARLRIAHCRPAHQMSSALFLRCFSIAKGLYAHQFVAFLTKFFILASGSIFFIMASSRPLVFLFLVFKVYSYFPFGQLSSRLTDTQGLKWWYFQNLFTFSSIFWRSLRKIKRFVLSSCIFTCHSVPKEWKSIHSVVLNRKMEDEISKRKQKEKLWRKS